MKKHMLVALGLTVLLGVALLPAANAQDTAMGTATAVIVDGISITSERSLDFGSVAATSAGGTVTLTPDAATTRTSTGIVVIASTPTSAQFDVTGAANAAYSIVIPTTDVTITSTSDPLDTMKVDTFTSTPTVAAGGTISNTNTDVIYVGATLRVGANQAPGTYTGTLDVTVEYN